MASWFAQWRRINESIDFGKARHLGHDPATLGVLIAIEIKVLRLWIDFIHCRHCGYVGLGDEQIIIPCGVRNDFRVEQQVMI